MIRTTDPSDEDSSHVRWTGQVMPTTNSKLLHCRTSPPGLRHDRHSVARADAPTSEVGRAVREIQ